MTWYQASLTTTALMLTFLMISGCSSTDVQRIKPPAVWLQDCPVSGFDGQTYGDLVLHAVSLREALELCNSDKAALRRWADDN